MSCVLIVLFLPMCFFFKLCISMDKTLEHECLNSEFLNVVARNFCFNHAFLKSLWILESKVDS